MSWKYRKAVKNKKLKANKCWSSELVVRMVTKYPDEMKLIWMARGRVGF